MSNANSEFKEKKEGVDQQNVWIIIVVTIVITTIVYVFSSPPFISEVALWSDDLLYELPIIWSRWLDLLLVPVDVCLFLYFFSLSIRDTPVSLVAGAVVGVLIGFYFGINDPLLPSLITCLVIAIILSLCLSFGIGFKFAVIFFASLFTVSYFMIGFIHGVFIGALIALFFLIIAFIKLAASKK